MTPHPPSRDHAERRKEDLGPPAGMDERRINDSDRRKENNEEYVSFTIEDQLLGIPVSEVQEVLFPKPLAAVPLGHPAVAGLLNLRGQIVTAISLRTRLSLPRENPEKSMNIIVAHKDELFSLVVDQVGDVIPVQRSTFSPPPASLDKQWAEVCEGVHQLKRGLLVIVHVDTLLNFETKL